jgi:hypothetical protein
MFFYDIMIPLFFLEKRDYFYAQSPVDRHNFKPFIDYPFNATRLLHSVLRACFVFFVLQKDPGTQRSLRKIQHKEHKGIVRLLLADNH